MTPEAIALVENHYSLIEPITRQVTRAIAYPLDFDELKSIAGCALVDAAERWPVYCAKNGYDEAALEYFVAYAKRRMQGAIRDSLRTNDWVKRQARSNAKRLQMAGLGQGVGEHELSRRTGMPLADVRATMQAIANSPVSFDNEQSGTAGTVVAARDVEGAAFERDAMTVVCEVMGALSFETRVVLVLHYYLGHELQDVALAMDITESRASVLHSEGVLTVLESLRELASERVLEPAC